MKSNNNTVSRQVCLQAILEDVTPAVIREIKFCVFVVLYNKIFNDCSFGKLVNYISQESQCFRGRENNMKCFPQDQLISLDEAFSLN